MITEFAGALRYSAASKTDFSDDGGRPSRNRGFRSRSMLGTPLAAPESARSGRVRGTLKLTAFGRVVSEVGNESKECFFTRALRRSPRFRIVIAKQLPHSNDGRVEAMCDFFRVRIVSLPDASASWNPPCIADGRRGVFPVYDECMAIRGVIS